MFLDHSVYAALLVERERCERKANDRDLRPMITEGPRTNIASANAMKCPQPASSSSVGQQET